MKSMVAFYYYIDNIYFFACHIITHTRNTAFICLNCNLNDLTFIQ